MARYRISEIDWVRLAPLLPGREGTRGRSGDDNRRFLEAVVWMAQHGGPWRHLPEEFGPWNTVWRRFNRWSKAGVWQHLVRSSKSLELDRTLLHTIAELAHPDATHAGDGASLPGVLQEPRSSALRVDAG